MTGQSGLPLTRNPARMPEMVQLLLVSQFLAIGAAFTVFDTALLNFFSSVPGLLATPGSLPYGWLILGLGLPSPIAAPGVTKNTSGLGGSVATTAAGAAGTLNLYRVRLAASRVVASIVNGGVAQAVGVQLYGCRRDPGSIGFVDL